MISAAEVARSIRGALRLARLDPNGIDEFDRSVGGFWRSFWAAVFLAPAYLLIGAIDYQAIEMPASAGRYFAVEAIGYVISWVAFPLAMFYIANMMDRAHHFITYIVAYNWCQIVQMAVFLPIAVLSPPGMEGAQSGWSLLMTLATLLILFYLGYVAKTALKINAAMAAGVVAVDVGLSLLIASVKNLITLPA